MYKDVCLLSNNIHIKFIADFCRQLENFRANISQICSLTKFIMQTQNSII